MQKGLSVAVLDRQPLRFDLIAKARQILLLDVNQFDGLLTDLLPAVVEEVEAFTGLSVGEQTRRVSYSFVSGHETLPYPPFRTVVDTLMGTVVDADGQFTAEWPAGGFVTYTCGYDETTIPASLLGVLALRLAERSGLNPALKSGGWKAIALPLSRLTWAS